MQYNLQPFFLEKQAQSLLFLASANSRLLGG